MELVNPKKNLGKQTVLLHGGLIIILPCYWYRESDQLNLLLNATMRVLKAPLTVLVMAKVIAVTVYLMIIVHLMYSSRTCIQSVWITASLTAGKNWTIYVSFLLYWNCVCNRAHCFRYKFYRKFNPFFHYLFRIWNGINRLYLHF